MTGFVTLGLDENMAEWIPGRIRLFLSHLTEHKVFVTEVANGLERLGLAPFVAHRDIPGSEEWREDIIRSVSKCNAIVLFLHKGFYKSQWCDQETGMAIALGKKVIPLRFHNEESEHGGYPRGFAQAYQAVDVRDLDASDVAEHILSALARSPEYEDAVKDGLVDALCKSESFAEASGSAQRLERVMREVDWTLVRVNRLQVALEHNSQVSGSYVATPYVRRVIAEFQVRAQSGDLATDYLSLLPTGTVTTLPTMVESFRRQVGMSDELRAILDDDDGGGVLDVPF